MKYTTVSIPDPLNKKVQKLIKDSGFASTSSFVTFVLREILAGHEDKSSFSGAESVKAQLEALGYLKKKKS